MQVKKAVPGGAIHIKRLQLSLFEKVILVNSIMLVGEAIAGLWVTSHSVEAHHYLIDTSFIVAATLLTLSINVIVLRASFKPLFHLLTTMREVSNGVATARARVAPSAAEISELAQTFNNMLDQLEAARQEQTKLILQAQEEERRRFALELHDEAGQNLTALLIHIELLNQYQAMLTPPEISDKVQHHFTSELRQLSYLTQHTLETIRQMSQQLRPSVLDDLGLLAAFRWLVEDSSQRLHIQVKLEIIGLEDAEKLPPAHEIALFRIAQESLTNIVRHAHTPSATIRLQKIIDHISIKISDDGCGYDQAKSRNGSGLIGMRERATLLQGELYIHSTLGKGTTVTANLPLPKTSSPEEQHIEDIEYVN